MTMTAPRTELRGDHGAAQITNVKRRAAAIVLSYLVVTLPLALRSVTANGAAAMAVPGATTARAWLVLAVHVACVVVVAFTTRRGPRGRWPNAAADWLPLLLVAFLYSELPWLMAGYRGGAPVLYHDALVQRWELAIFGAQPSHTLAGALPFPWLSEPLHLGYVSYYLIIYLPPLLLYAGGRREAFERVTGALLLAFTSCFLVFALFPVEGPRYAFSPPPGVPDAPVRRAALWILGSGSSRGAAFPSSHAAVAVAQTVACWLVGARRIAAGAGVFTALLVAGAVYGGFHYATDMAAGVVVGAAVGSTVLVRRLPSTS